MKTFLLLCLLEEQLLINYSPLCCFFRPWDWEQVFTGAFNIFILTVILIRPISAVSLTVAHKMSFNTAT